MCWETIEIASRSAAYNICVDFAIIDSRLAQHTQETVLRCTRTSPGSSSNLLSSLGTNIQSIFIVSQIAIHVPVRCAKLRRYGRTCCPSWSLFGGAAAGQADDVAQPSPISSRPGCPAVVSQRSYFGFSGRVLGRLAYGPQLLQLGGFRRAPSFRMRWSRSAPAFLDLPSMALAPVAGQLAGHRRLEHRLPVFLEQRPGPLQARHPGVQLAEQLVDLVRRSAACSVMGGIGSFTRRRFVCVSAFGIAMAACCDSRDLVPIHALRKQLIYRSSITRRNQLNTDASSLLLGFAYEETLAHRSCDAK